MTEAEWLACEDPKPMLASVFHGASERKLRLFAVSCCRPILHSLTESQSCRNAVEAGERFADGLATEAERAAAFDACVHFAGSFAFSRLPALASASGKDLREWITQVPDFLAETIKEQEDRDDETLRESISSGQRAFCRALRDLFNPFGAALLGVHDKAITTLAQAIYDEGAFSRLPILAEAMKQAGCTDTAILAHCLGLDEHVRGCWAVDLVLAKE